MLIGTPKKRKSKIRRRWRSGIRNRKIDKEGE
jgi:hypothetical protein